VSNKTYKGNTNPILIKSGLQAFVNQLINKVKCTQILLSAGLK